ncbi:FAD-dependent oxidoreductase [Paenibacillus sp. UNC451MF]|uniref:FAD-dependent oxidoreductase n=1 Tax=Paenibacillus sp. UNC451MF TaxID=1449063 RepID=UPI00048DA5FC|nr:FAD-dependent oxidoreductase [Paenibacillus sp. UNC451MF]
MKLKRMRVGLGVIIFIAMMGGTLGWFAWKKHDAAGTNPQQPLMKVESVAQVKERYDAIVIGTDPEGITAAVSAARNGLKVLLVDGRDREILGGLMTLGWLNTLDLNYAPQQPAIPGKHNFLNKGIFQEWYDQIEGTSFDTHTAANVFYKMVRSEPNIDLLMKAKEIKPLVQAGRAGNEIAGVTIVSSNNTSHSVYAKTVIDATQDGDIAAMAGAPFTTGRQDIADPDSQMAVTLVFKLGGITPKVWESFGKHPNTGSDKMSAWGFPEMKEYVSTNKERVRMRGLNIGRQNDNTILINAMQIFGVDPLNPESVREGIEIGKKEAEHVVSYMKNNFSEFKQVELLGTAPELYVRETRHMQGEYRLSMADLMENRDYWDAIAYGSYEVDIQSTHYKDPGSVMMKPKQYGVPFRSLVPLKVDGLLVVGRAASFDSLPHGSARVIPLGMATGEAAGAAAKIAIDQGMTFRQLSQSKDGIAALRDKLIQQKVELMLYSFDKPAYTLHKSYRGLKAAVSMAVTLGGYDNTNWDLEGKSNPQRFVSHMANVRKVHPAQFQGEATLAIRHMPNPAALPLTLDQAALTLATATGLKSTREEAVADLVQRGWLKMDTVKQISDPDQLTNGESYMLIRDVVENAVGVKYE